MTLIEYTNINIKDNEEPLVNLSDYNFVLEPKYFQQGLSNDPNLYLREGIANMLSEVQEVMDGNKFKIWDAYRSRDVQNNIYQKYFVDLKSTHSEWDDKKLKLETGKFVSPPYDMQRIPPHATGGSVDLTLVDKNGGELEMGTDFDYFGPEATWNYFDINLVNDKVKNNRALLRNTLLHAGFRKDEDEWWHFDYGNQIWALELNKKFAIYGEIEL